MKRFSSTLASAAVAAALLVPAFALADTIGPITFETPTYSVGTINGQDGWSSTGAYDQGVVTNPTISGLQSFRISDAITSGAFGDQTFAKSLINSVGETAATAGTFATGTKQTHFEMQFDFASATSTQQPGMHLSVSPDRGDGSRMSYLRFDDLADGIHVYFDDVTDAGPLGTVATFNETDIGTITRGVHTIKLTMDTIDGPANDVVKTYIDGTLVHTGTSWEDYYRFDPEAATEQSPRIVKTVEFRESGTANTADAGKGYLIDSLSLLSGPTVTPPPATVKVTIDKFIDGVAASTTAATTLFPMSASWNATNIGAGSGSFSLGPVGFNSPNGYEAVTGDMTTGASYSTNENLPTSCTAGNQYALVGYSTGTSFAAAIAAATSTSAPNFTEMNSNEYVIVWNKTCAATPTLKVHILKYLDGVKATSVPGNYLFPMSATWNAVNTGAGSGSYVLGTNFGGAADLYGADTAPMSAPADYVTSEVTDNSNQVVASSELCAPGKYLLNGYRTSSVSFADAATQPLELLPHQYTAITSDQYVLVDNSSCPNSASLTIEKDTIGGNGTFNFTSNIPGHTNFSITTISGVGSQTFANVAPGTYHVTEASSTGWTQTDSECSTAGVVVAAGAAPVCIITNTKNAKLGEIRGTKYEDRDGDGKLKDGDHHRLSGWTIYLDTNNNGALDGAEPSTVTDSHGNYRFLSLPAGTYHVREVGQAGWIQTYPATGKYDITLAAGKISKKDDFGNFRLGSIAGMKYNDANGNGKKDFAEVGLAGWTINLVKVGTPGTTTTVTDASGNYSFSGLTAGTYKLSEVAQAGWNQTQHPGAVKIQSGTKATKDNFGNTQRPLDSDGDYDGSPANEHHNDHNQNH